MANRSGVEKTNSPHRIRVGIVGARGYSGLELARLLLRHPQVELNGCFSNDAQFSLRDYLPELSAADVPTWPLTNFATHAKDLDTIFLATPAEVSLELAPKGLAAGANIIDLSGAFRLRDGDVAHRSAQYKKWYGFEHTEQTLLAKAVYGLQPLVGARVSSAPTKPTLIANPGCYASAVSLALIPLLRAKLIDPNSIVIDAKSGATGAGRKASESLLFSEVEGECLPYKIAQHQHWPEIVEAVAGLSGSAIAPFFSTHLLNVRRGIVASIYARLTDAAIGPQDGAVEERLRIAYHESFLDYSLVRFGALGDRQNDRLLWLKNVVGTPRLHITYRVDQNKLYLFSCIDNLLKGAASQAVENLNALHGWPIDLSLTHIEGVL